MRTIIYSHHIFAPLSRTQKKVAKEGCWSFVEASAQNTVNNDKTPGTTTTAAEEEASLVLWVSQTGVPRL